MKEQSLCAGVSVDLKKEKEAVMKVPSASHKIQPVVWIPSLLALFIYCCEYCKVLISPDGKSQLHNDLIDVWKQKAYFHRVVWTLGRKLWAVFEVSQLLFRHHIL